MLKRIFPILLTLAVFLTACGTQGTPTMAPVDVQNTAVAAAWTMVAETQLAIPSATPLPPTEVPSPTPLPTFTPEQLQVLSTLPVATLPIISLPTSTVAAVGGCTDTTQLNVAEAGITSPIRIENESGGTLTYVTFYLNEGTNKFGQCGNIAVYKVTPGAWVTLQLPKGTYSAYASISYKNGSSGFARGGFTLNQGFEDIVSVIVRQEIIVAK